MKKRLLLLALLVICLMLCACGNMSGAEAAALYPDIIGSWGTDIFGDEFVLHLENDGTCTIMDYQGTWKLDSKNSNENFVELIVKTENTNFFVRLERNYAQQSYDIQDVTLLIMDSKQKNTVYENRVFNPADCFITEQTALEILPELVGEWGSPYWHEDSIMTIHEDGTCTLLQQSGRWCILRNQPISPDTDLFIKLDNGSQYRVYFWLDQDVDWGYSRGVMDVSEFNNFHRIFPDTEQPAQIVNRAQIIHPMEFASIAVGEWYEEDREEPFAIIREDGTCTIRGADGLWTLDYVSYYDERFRNGWDYCLLAQIDGAEYDIRFDHWDDDSFHMYIMNPSNALSLLEAGFVYKNVSSGN